MKKIGVMIVDDSASVRQTLAEVLSSDPQIEVLGVAADPLFAAAKMHRTPPDVLILDVEMPRMDGLTFLRRIMAQHPMPVIMCSSLSQRGTEISMEALESGAVEVIAKPKIGTTEFLLESREMLCHAVHAAAQARPKRRLPAQEIDPKLTADAVLAPAKLLTTETTDKVVVMGASTGGTEALRVVLEALPGDAPGMAIVQHMPEHFTAAFARRLNGLCRLEVKEAEDGDPVVRGRALIAAGNRHLLLKRSGARYYVEVRDGPPVCRHRPSVDVLFRSAARYASKNAVGVLLTGMGDDGARGMLELKEAGAATIAQDESTCVVFGMPNEAIKRGAAGHVLPLPAIAPMLGALC
jgi:two-component system chemotaxis response regulator CheB